MPGGRAGRRVDHHVDLAGGDPLDHGRLAVRAGALPVLAHPGGGDPVAAQHVRGALGGQDLEPEVDQPFHREDHRSLVDVGDRDEDLPAVGQAAVGRGRRRGEGGRPAVCDG